MRLARTALAWAAAHEARIRRFADLSAVAIPALFLAMALITAFPFVDDVPLDSREMDDWVSYKLFAHSVYRDGLAMPVVPGPYGAREGTVHGFIYPYFVAGVFTIFGENTAWVYVIQSALVGASASFVYLAWRRAVSPLAGLVLVLGSAAIVFLDIYRSIGFRLLSENLFVFLMAVSFAGLVEAQRRRSVPIALIGGVALGLAVLSRTNFLVASLALLGAAALYNVRRGRLLGVTLALALGFALGMSPLPLREVAATGQPDLILLRPNPGDLYPPPTTSMTAFAEHYGRRALFTIGFTTAEEPGYRWRPHWLAIWAGCFAWAVWRARRPAPDLRETAVLLVIVLYLGPIIALSYPSNYGARMLTVALPLVFSLGVLWLDRSLGTPGPVAARRGLVTTTTT